MSLATMQFVTGNSAIYVYGNNAVYVAGNNAICHWQQCNLCHWQQCVSGATVMCVCVSAGGVVHKA
jgi:hypothetical protein